MQNEGPPLSNECILFPDPWDPYHSHFGLGFPKNRETDGVSEKQVKLRATAAE